VRPLEASCRHRPHAAFVAGGLLYPFLADVVPARPCLIFTAEYFYFVGVAVAAFEQRLCG